MKLYSVAFFILHCILHVFCYWIPRSVGACVDLLLCRPCRTSEKRRHGYSYHPAREVRLIHNAEYTEAAVKVFGLMDVRASTLEDRQYCFSTVSGANEKNEARKARSAPLTPIPLRDAGCASTSAFAGEDVDPSASATAARTHHGNAASYSPLEPSFAFSAAPSVDGTYNSQRHPRLSSSFSHPPREQITATTPAATTSVPPAPAAKKALHIPTYKSPSKAFKKDIKRCSLKYSAPLYGPHLSTIMGAYRPTHPVQYTREEMCAWDGCYLAMDWFYVAGEAPTTYDHEHTSRVRKAGERCDRAANEPFSGVQGEAAVPSSAAEEGCRVDNAHRDRASATHASSGAACVDEMFSIAPATTEAEKGGVRGVASGRQRATEDAPLETSRNSLPTYTTSDGTVGPNSNSGSSRPDIQKLAETPILATTHYNAVGVAFIVPGLTSSSQTNYVQHLVRALHKANLHVCVLNTRGLGDSPPITTPFLFNGAYTRDVRDCLHHFFAKEALADRFGRPLPLIGIGLSIGGTIMAKYVGEEGAAGADPHLDALICVCPPVDYVMTVEHMNRNGAQRALYQRDMCNSIRRYLLQHDPLQRMPKVDNDWVFVQGNIHRFRRVLHFDEHVIAKSSGYRSVHHYHVDASALTWLPYAPIPALVMASADDPVIGCTVMPHRWREITCNNPRVVYVESSTGGHLGFLSDPWSELMCNDNWMEIFVRDRVLAACDYWYAVQRRAKDLKPSSGGEGSRGSAASNVEAHPPPLSLPATVDSPVTNVAVTASAPSAVTPETLSYPSWSMMRVVPEVCAQNRATVGKGCYLEGSDSSASAAIYRARQHDRRGQEQPAALANGFDAATHGGVAVSSTDEGQMAYSDRGCSTYLVASTELPASRDHADGRDASSTHEPIQDASAAAAHLAMREHRSSLSSSPQVATEKDTANPPPCKSLAPATAGSASPQPIPCGLPHQGRPNNWCYFTSFRTQPVPRSRLMQPYFAPPSGTTYDGERSEVNDTVFKSTASSGDERGSTYVTWPDVNGACGGRRSACHDQNQRGEGGILAMGKDPRCRVTAGQYMYAPVVVNCDYAGDPRTWMGDG
ncbi:hypothetical protein ABL78_3737 [Leptomonas seymouri]|uniref:Serine aminopeptidase S33 domain-containing protein n=1 Tax=Leptomonas seymouri TaxID=5684 RepID=A0A0N1PDK7_LEPSE|nr:hypothetical protein ABL78_3737 [Leptomonas seymouri]|eukprot:KPI87175.1 hypothetical protein ABL78_3737 [Leptomonas seymouri]